ncbi:MAG: hypothetical protein HOG03_10420 [Desulfobacula sp.]|jgi:hypothetical protein|uniref:hypothetical protein n=1 Tax=Desulfobacula sp. TaxID=2593537 RepID=UPI001D1F2F87|nr:hypothetical protein [Desulfobacula sp.]MBT4025487.1 hypothetical protein [Desulfobacula sp.]MBT6340929.1 hypothetical protein [Desulfobacula sp.]MBT6751982.1 hypothetical protein [Desulfobacula sp.]MBT7050581.1 hypothetical protein [Desulfobacula sp.]
MKIIFPYIIGFFFALLLFSLQEFLKKRQKKKVLIKYLNRELKYNTALMNQWIKDIKHDIYYLKWAKPIFTFTPQFNKFRTLFLNKVFDSGIIYDLLSDKHIESINIMMTFFSVEKQLSIKTVINKYKDVETMDEDGMSGIEFIKEFLKDHLEIIKREQEELNQIIPLIMFKDNKLIQRAKNYKEIVSKKIFNLR